MVDEDRFWADGSWSFQSVEVNSKLCFQKKFAMRKYWDLFRPTRLFWINETHNKQPPLSKQPLTKLPIEMWMSGYCFFLTCRPNGTRYTKHGCGFCSQVCSYASKCLLDLWSFEYFSSHLVLQLAHGFRTIVIQSLPRASDRFFVLRKC